MSLQLRGVPCIPFYRERLRPLLNKTHSTNIDREVLREPSTSPGSGNQIPAWGFNFLNQVPCLKLFYRAGWKDAPLNLCILTGIEKHPMVEMVHYPP